MGKYSDIKGFTVQTVSTDPVASQALGGSWSSGGSLNTARPAAGASSGNDGNSALFIMSGASNSNIVESYNGSAFTDNAMSSSNGSSTATIFIGGNPAPARAGKTESWDGSSWTETGDLNTSRGQGAGTGISTASLVFGGVTTAYVGIVEQWDGSSWTEVADLNTTRANLAGMGLYTASIAAGGRAPGSSPPIRGDVELWNGSSWTETTEVNTARAEVSGSGVPYTDVIVYGGEPSTANTEFWNGSSWTELNNLSSAGSRISQNMGASASATLAFQQASPGQTTEEWTAPSTFGKQVQGQLFFNSTANAFKETIFDLPAGSWSSGGDLNTARKGSSGFGVLTSNIVAGGLTTTIVNSVESYDGSSWTEITELNTARRSGKAVGSTTAGLVIAGVGAPPSRQAQETENWNGSAWTEVGDINRSTATQSFGSAGASNTSAMIFGGEPGTGEFQYTETWDGSSWTEVNNLNTGRQSPAGFGIVTGAICAGGYSPPAPPGNVVASNESWDGTNWTEVNDLNTARGQQGGSGAFTAGLIYGGNAPPGRQTKTESWNGTSYTELNDMATSRYEFGYAPNGVSPQGNTGAIVAGGYTTTNVATTEEWDVPLANKTITST